MNEIKDRITNKTALIEGHSLLRFSAGEQESSTDREKYSMQRKALRFTRKAAADGAKRAVKTTLHHGKRVHLRMGTGEAAQTQRNGQAETGGKSLRFSDGEQENSADSRKYPAQVKALRFTRKAAADDVKRTVKTTLRPGQTIRLRQTPEKAVKPQQGDHPRTVYIWQDTESVGHDKLHFEPEKAAKPQQGNHPRAVYMEQGAGRTAATGSVGHSKLHFEGEKSATGHSKLMFTEAEKAADAPTSSESIREENSNRLNKAKTFKSAKGKMKVASRSIKSLKQDLSDEISKQADASENDAVRAADRERKIVGVGLKYGGRVGKWHRGGRDARQIKRESKKTAKEIKLEQKAERYFERTGREPPGAVRQQKRQMKRKQIRTFVDTKLGKKKVDIALKVMRFVLGTAKKVIVAAVSYIGFPLLGVVAVVALLFGMAAMFFGLMQTTAITMLSAYTSADADIEAASMLATKLEAKLEQEISGIPSQWKWGHIDEFRYDVDTIGHDPFELMAYLSVTYPGFDMGLLSPVPGDIERLHDTRYDLILEQQVETRYYTETHTDPVTGEKTEEEVAYDYYILNVILRGKSIEAAVAPQLRATPEGELWEWYGVLMETRGARQEFTNPFAGDWRGNVTSLYGYRLNPPGTNLQTHRGLDIAMPEGTPIAAGLTGRVRHVGYDTVFGKYIIIEDEKGRTIQYAHCSSIEAAEGGSVTAGEKIAAVGNTGTSTGSHVHIEIKRDGQYLNPIYALEFGGNEE